MPREPGNGGSSVLAGTLHHVPSVLGSEGSWGSAGVERYKCVHVCPSVHPSLSSHLMLSGSASAKLARRVLLSNLVVDHARGSE